MNTHRLGCFLLLNVVLARITVLGVHQGPYLRGRRREPALNSCAINKRHCTYPLAAVWDSLEPHGGFSRSFTGIAAWSFEQASREVCHFTAQQVNSWDFLHYGKAGPVIIDCDTAVSLCFFSHRLVWVRHHAQHGISRQISPRCSLPLFQEAQGRMLSDLLGGADCLSSSSVTHIPLCEYLVCGEREELIVKQFSPWISHMFPWCCEPGLLSVILSGMMVLRQCCFSLERCVQMLFALGIAVSVAPSLVLIGALSSAPHTCLGNGGGWVSKLRHLVTHRRPPHNARGTAICSGRPSRRFANFL